jgi:hypothetical protein
MIIKAKIKNLTNKLYPTGRAFQRGLIKEKLNEGLALSEERAYNSSLSIFDSILPDNDNFTSQDATDWERRLGLPTNNLVDLEDRKLAILRKMNHPNDVIARSNFAFLQEQLRAAGFDVYVFENIFDDGFGNKITKSPQEFGGVGSLFYQMGGNSQMGMIQMGTYYGQFIANDVNEDIDSSYILPLVYESTFFIGGSPLGTIAYVPIERKNEFRQLVLRLKPVQCIAFTFINYN